MITIIAEKPSVAMELAHIVGARKREDGYISGNGYAVTWAFGHLVEIYPEEGESWDSPLPVIPETFLLRVGQTRGKDGSMRPDSGYSKQLSVIKKLFSQSEYIINAGDAGREGELIQRYIYQYVGATTPVRRLWISSLTDEAIREGLKNLRPSSEYDNLFLAGKARSEADWLVGINGTRAMTKVAGGDGVRSLGRVQTPTLALVCRRYLENRSFEPESFWTIMINAALGQQSFTVRSDEKFKDYDSAYRALDAVQRCGILTVDSVEKKDVSQQPPLLYDLTSLQREANKKFSMSAQEVLNTAQDLYEKKFITYPRTGSRYVTEDVYRTLPALLSKLSVGNYGTVAAKLSREKLSRHSVNDSKVTDHHALLPTGQIPTTLSTSGSKIYGLILTRLLEAVSPKCELISTAVHLSSAGVGFTARANIIVEPGWRSVRNEHEKEKDEDGNDIAETLPPFHEGDACHIQTSETVEGKTKPKPLYTEASLLEAMEHAGREVQDEELRDAIKDCGLGTPATRAGEIETLLRRGYMERQARNLVPTQLGLSIYEAVKEKSIADVEMTASWEKTLAGIAEGTEDAGEFNRGIREYARKIVSEILADGSVGLAVQSAQTIPGTKCPACGRAMLLTTKVARCVDDNCGWKIWRTVSGKALSEREIVSLLNTGTTGEVKGFRSKDGKPFAAKLNLQEDGRLAFEFIDHSKNANGDDLLCPKCGKAVRVSSQAVNCRDEACGWKLWRTIAGKTVTEPMLDTLLSGGTTPVIRGFRSKAGKTFDAALRLNSESDIEFLFQDKKQTRKIGR